MGMLMSYTGGTGGDGLASKRTKTLTYVKGALYEQFVDKDIKDFDAFHVAILDIFNTINMGLPGKHYDAPAVKEVKDLFNQWNGADKQEDRKKIFTDFMNKNVNLGKIDYSMMITGIVTGIVAPPAFMVVKKTAQTLPLLSVIKSIPDVVFVPTATIVALIAVMISKRMLSKKVAP